MKEWCSHCQKHNQAWAQKHEMYDVLKDEHILVTEIACDVCNYTIRKDVKVRGMLEVTR